MKLIAYRIAKKRFASTIWSGTGAKQHGGRWNSKGVAVVDASENRALAAMEQLVHLVPPRVLRGFVISSLEFDETQVQRINIKGLPAGWDRPVPLASLRKYGDDCVRRGDYVALAVPSAIIPDEWNYLINPSHPEFHSLRKSTPVPFIYDKRLR